MRHSLPAALTVLLAQVLVPASFVASLQFPPVGFVLRYPRRIIKFCWHFLFRGWPIPKLITASLIVHDDVYSAVIAVKLQTASIHFLLLLFLRLCRIGKLCAIPL